MSLQSSTRPSGCPAQCVVQVQVVQPVEEVLQHLPKTTALLRWPSAGCVFRTPALQDNGDVRLSPCQISAKWSINHNNQLNEHSQA